ncbi:hypothetical protein DAI22_08g173600 [Oryza sativa Japonica Group]|nr:hypothetical protein DAI22_08g173600 [Oryza sativa Japonica Group]
MRGKRQSIPRSKQKRQDRNGKKKNDCREGRTRSSQWRSNGARKRPGISSTPHIATAADANAVAVEISLARFPFSRSRPRRDGDDDDDDS